jgi:hypothetical protein
MQPDDFWYHHVRQLAGLVGGIDQLEGLDDAPLAGTPFDWTAVAEVHRPVVADILGAVETRATTWLDDEYQAVVHRLIERISVHQAEVLARGSCVRTAAALVWLALRGNGAFARARGMQAKFLWHDFGVTSCSERGRTLYAALGLPVRPVSWQYDRNDGDDVWLAHPELLHSTARSMLVDRRQSAIEYILNQRQREADAYPIHDMGNGTLRVRGRPTDVRWVQRGTSDSGRLIVMIAVGDADSDKVDQVLALSVPNARLLVTQLEQTLAAPMR